MIEMLTLARWMHVIGAAVLLGTGSGIAFFMLMAHRTGNVKVIAHVASTVVLADLLFTASAVIIQPLSGIWLAQLVGWPLTTPWILWSVGLYVFVGMLWLPVVWMQLRMRDLARESDEREMPLSDDYHRLYRLWFSFGVPAFLAMLVIIWLMLERPTI